MKISFVSFNNNINTYQLNSKKQASNASICTLHALGCDSVSFSGNSQTNVKNECDRAFVYILSNDFKLNEQQTADLEKILSDFLKEKNIQSLTDMSGSGFMDKQVDLQKRISQKFSLPEELSEYLMDEIARRCDSEENYIPYGLKRFRMLDDCIRDFIGNGHLNVGFCKDRSMNADDDFYSFVKRVLRLSSIKGYEFREFVENYIEENNLGSITNLFNNKDLEEEQKNLMVYIENEFDLSDYESYVIDSEFRNRAQTDVNSEHYYPLFSVYSKDVLLYRKIIEDGGYNYDIGNKDFRLLLLSIMEDDAEKNKCRTLFDFLKLKNEFENSNALRFIMSSKLSEEQKSNLIIDLVDAANNVDKYEEQMPKHPHRDAYIIYGRAKIAKDTIISILGINEYTDMGEDIIQILMNVYSQKVADKKDLMARIAFDISDKYSFPGGAEKEIIKIINDVQKLSPYEVEEYMNNCK